MQYISVLDDDASTESSSSQYQEEPTSLDQESRHLPLGDDGDRDVEEDDTILTGPLDYHDQDGTRAMFQKQRPNLLLVYPSMTILLTTGFLIWMIAIVAAPRFVSITTTETTPQVLSATVQDNNVTVMMGYFRYDKIIGHLHMAKTAGTEINGELAAHYERVCGNKG